MKTTIMLAAALFAIMTTNQTTAQKNAETDAIKKVIDQETRAFFEKKYDLWASTWVQDATAFRISASPTEYSALKGFNSMIPDTKAFMQGEPYTEAEMAQYLNKFDYKFYINGNTATVFFKEGLSDKDAAEESRLMEKQNGQWKIAGMTLISAPAYKLASAQLLLRKFIGKWSIIKETFKSEPADTAYKVLAASVDMHEIMNGLEASSSFVGSNNGNISSTSEIEQFIADNNINKFRYYDNAKTTDGNMYGGYGTAEFDSAGNFVVSAMYDDTPLVRFKNIYTLNNDGSMHVVVEFYSKEGKKTYSMYSNFARL